MSVAIADELTAADFAGYQRVLLKHARTHWDSDIRALARQMLAADRRDRESAPPVVAATGPGDPR